MPGAWRLSSQPTGGRTLQDQVGRQQPIGAEEQPQDGRRELVRRTRDHPERPTWQPKVREIGADHGDLTAGVPIAQERGPPRMQLDGDYPRAGVEEWIGQRAGARTEVEHQVARRDG